MDREHTSIVYDSVLTAQQRHQAQKLANLPATKITRSFSASSTIAPGLDGPQMNLRNETRATASIRRLASVLSWGWRTASSRRAGYHADCVEDIAAHPAGCLNPVGSTVFAPGQTRLTKATAALNAWDPLFDVGSLFQCRTFEMGHIGFARVRIVTGESKKAVERERQAGSSRTCANIPAGDWRTRWKFKSESVVLGQLQDFGRGAGWTCFGVKNGDCWHGPGRKSKRRRTFGVLIVPQSYGLLDGSTHVEFAEQSVFRFPRPGILVTIQLANLLSSRTPYIPRRRTAVRREKIAPRRPIAIRRASLKLPKSNQCQDCVETTYLPPLRRGLLRDDVCSSGKRAADLETTRGLRRDDLYSSAEQGVVLRRRISIRRVSTDTGSKILKSNQDQDYSETMHLRPASKDLSLNMCREGLLGLEYMYRLPASEFDHEIFETKTLQRRIEKIKVNMSETRPQSQVVLRKASFQNTKNFESERLRSHTLVDAHALVHAGSAGMLARIQAQRARLGDGFWLKSHSDKPGEVPWNDGGVPVF
ncbi:uncharacterized protein EV420DRAFT_1484041 [Desarmillaria tabescens]|uniref:Uncharacterized protein n=1 Tax=Armillaria tabescens TaxID=1929756 RepID=A0AA39JP75_ARMTA|nr:uncharacterized protein EV420DRAFT_1484041 [Desarmillaria tabescens]KAK0446380.1 hypothetical protein EV420DRAFT_1484041 [Desarmillaria tabescens]